VKNHHFTQRKCDDIATLLNVKMAKMLDFFHFVEYHQFRG